MLSKEVRKKLPWILLGIVLFAVATDFLFWWASLNYAPYANVCDPTSNNQDCDSYNVLLAFAVTWAYKFNYWGSLITAISTGFIALFTWTLWQSGETNIGILRTQTKLVRTQATIALNQHYADHRPHMRVRHVALGSREDPLTRLPGIGERVIGGLVVVNAGGTKAKIIDSRYLIYTGMSRDGLPMYSPMDEKWDTLLEPGKTFQIGESVALQIKGTMTVDRPPGTFLTLGKDGWTVFVMGQIQFQDEDGNDRFMGFCRQWSGEGTFRAVNDPDYEYED